MNSSGNSVVVEGAVVSTAPLIVVFIRGGRAHVKDGVQTAYRHNLIFAYFWRILLHSRPQIGSPTIPLWLFGGVRKTSLGEV